MEWGEFCVVDCVLVFWIGVVFVVVLLVYGMFFVQLCYVVVLCYFCYY